MGIFGRMFSSDPQRDLDRAAQNLEKGAVEKALQLANRVLKKEPESRQAQEIIGQIHEVRVRDFIHSADRCEASGYPEDAVGWLKQALDVVDDPRKQSELKKRITELGAQIQDPAPGPAVAVGEKPPVEEPCASDELQYDALVGMLTQEHAQRFEERPQIFQKAYLDLNEGRVDEAKTQFETLLEDHPDDPVYSFEYARCLMIKGQLPEAISHFEKVWDELGTDDLDEAGTVSVPAFWAEANLLLDREAQVVERLEPLANPENGREMLSLLYAQALEKLERLEDAADFLIRARRVFPSRPLISLLLGRLLDALGEESDAIAILENQIAPCCATGGCATPPLNLPCARLLIALYLKHDVDKARVEEMFRHLGRALSGNWTSDDLMLLAAFHRKNGDEESAREAEANANRIRQQGSHQSDAVPGGPIKAGDDALM